MAHTNKPVGILGLGESGLAMAKWLHRQGSKVRVADTRDNPPNQAALQAILPGVELHTGPLSASWFLGLSAVAVSPGVPLETPGLLESGLPLISEVELFAAALHELSASGQSTGKVLAITGSNGKTTTTALTAHLLNAAGVSAVACGNISPSVLDALMAAQDDKRLPEVWVLELSSFQLETTHHLNADAATVLNLSEDHLDRHHTLSAYAEAKRRIFQGQPVQILNRDDDLSLAMGRCGHKLVTFGLTPPPRAGDYGLNQGAIWRGAERLLALNDSPLTGTHNAANLMAALALCEAIGHEPKRTLPGLKTFSGLPHRVETVCEQDGIRYVDDSKGTNVGATLAAIQGMGQPVCIILGGDGKGQDFSPLKAALSVHGRAVALIGRDAGLLERALAGCCPLKPCASMQEAVTWLHGQAQAGDCILLSPACASLDMYRNYAHRADDFRAAVTQLISAKV